MDGRPAIVQSSPRLTEDGIDPVRDREEHWEHTRFGSPHHTPTQHLGTIEGDIRAAVGNLSEEVEVLVLSALGNLLHWPAHDCFAAVGGLRRCCVGLLEA
jgi:hypothetical protein